MTKDLIYVQYPTTDETQSVSSAKIVKSTVDPDNGVTIKGALANKNNTLVVLVENDGSASNITFVAGNVYPNAMLGSLTQPVSGESITAFQIQDPSRFERKDGSIDLEFDSGFTGSIYAVAKSTALNV